MRASASAAARPSTMLLAVATFESRNTASSLAWIERVGAIAVRDAADTTSIVSSFHRRWCR